MDKHNWGCTCSDCMEERLLKRTGIDITEIDTEDKEKDTTTEKVVDLLEWKKKRGL